MYQPACKPGFVRPASVSRRDGHSSGTPVARRLKQPTRMTGPDGPRAFAPLRHSYSVLLPVGFAVPLSLLTSAVGSYPTVSPLPLSQYATRPRRSVFCGTFPEALPCEGLNPAGRYPAPFVLGARTFLPGTLSSVAGAAVRPTDGNRNGGGGTAGQARGRNMARKKKARTGLGDRSGRAFGGQVRRVWEEVDSASRSRKLVRSARLT